MIDELNSSIEPEIEPQEAPGRTAIDVESRMGADAASGKSTSISWGARSDVGLVRGHNEDSYLLQAPLFVVCDGMGGHAAGEVASSIAVKSVGAHAPTTADDTLLGAAIEAANQDVIDAGERGEGSPGMGCTASAVFIEGSQMAVAHVGDSRVYLLRNGSLVRVTHDHSYVEELVDAGQITADEARTHPSRSVVTRALGSDPDMYADHFTLEVENGDRIIICSDGLSGMIPDSEIEAMAVSSALPQAAADNLVSEALLAGGSDNVTVIVVDVLDDGIAKAHRKSILKKAAIITAAIVVLLSLVFAGFLFFIHEEYYLANSNGYVAIYQGIPGDILGIPLSKLLETTSVEVNDLPESVQGQLNEGISFASEPLAHEAVESYRDQIHEEQERVADIINDISAESGKEQGSGWSAPAEGSDAAEGDSIVEGNVSGEGVTDDFSAMPQPTPNAGLPGPENPNPEGGE